MLVNIYKKKLRHYLLQAHSNTKVINEAEKIQRIKAKVVCQIMNQQEHKRLSKGFAKMVAYCLKKKNDQDRKRLKQKKTEIHNQIMLLSEKDTRIRKQEAFLSMKEQKIAEKEKEIKDKTKRITEMNKLIKEKQQKQ